MNTNRFVAAASVAVLASAAVSMARGPIETFRAAARPQFEVRESTGVLSWLTRSLPTARTGYLSAPCYQEQAHSAVTIEVMDTAAKRDANSPVTELSITQPSDEFESIGQGLTVGFLPVVSDSAFVASPRH